MLVFVVDLLDHHSKILTLYGLLAVASCYCCILVSKEAFLRLRYPQDNNLVRLVRIYALADVARIVLNQPEERNNTV